MSTTSPPAAPPSEYPPPSIPIPSTTPTTFNSPKRKRDPPLTPPSSSPNMRFNINIPTTGSSPKVDEYPAQGSPRTKVAYNFQGLRLEDGGAISKLDLQKSNAQPKKPKTKSAKGSSLGISSSIQQIEDEQEAAIRKRVKTLGEGVREIPETPSRAFTISIGPERAVDQAVVGSAKGVVLHNEIDPVLFSGKAAVIGRQKGVDKTKSQEGNLSRTYPSINRLSDSKSRTPRKRMSTPPLFGLADASVEMHDDNGGVVDPDRAALTWHDDEITGHDPSDPDDDGEGINGIGFRPTPAMAYARMERRRQQLAEYRAREAREARARRSERRRASERSDDSGKSREEKEAERRVRFMEVEKMSITSSG